MIFIFNQFALTFKEFWAGIAGIVCISVALGAGWFIRQHMQSRYDSWKRQPRNPMMANKQRTSVRRSPPSSARIAAQHPLSWPSRIWKSLFAPSGSSEECERIYASTEINW